MPAMPVTTKYVCERSNCGLRASAIVDAAALAWPMPVVMTQTPVSVHLTSGYSADRPGTRIVCFSGSWASQGAASGPNSVMTITLTGRAAAGPLAAATAVIDSDAATTISARERQWDRRDKRGSRMKAFPSLCVRKPGDGAGPRGRRACTAAHGRHARSRIARVETGRFELTNDFMLTSQAIESVFDDIQHFTFILKRKSLSELTFQAHCLSPCASTDPNPEIDFFTVGCPQ